MDGSTDRRTADGMLRERAGLLGDMRQLYHTKSDNSRLDPCFLFLLTPLRCGASPCLTVTRMNFGTKQLLMLVAMDGSYAKVSGGLRRCKVSLSPDTRNHMSLLAGMSHGSNVARCQTRCHQIKRMVWARFHHGSASMNDISLSHPTHARR